jgi:hypothetical protein
MLQAPLLQQKRGRQGMDRREQKGISRQQEVGSTDSTGVSPRDYFAFIAVSTSSAVCGKPALIFTSLPVAST